MPAHLIWSVTCDKPVIRVAEATTPSITSPFFRPGIRASSAVAAWLNCRKVIVMRDSESNNFVKTRNYYLIRDFSVKLCIIFPLKGKGIDI